jgi:hypothetical protein
MSNKDKKLSLRRYLVRALKRWWLATPFERADFSKERRLACVNAGTACASIVKRWQRTGVSVHFAKCPKP